MKSSGTRQLPAGQASLMLWLALTSAACGSAAGTSSDESAAAREDGGGAAPAAPATEPDGGEERDDDVPEEERERPGADASRDAAELTRDAGSGQDARAETRAAPDASGATEGVDAGSATMDAGASDASDAGTTRDASHEARDASVDARVAPLYAIGSKRRTLEGWESYLFVTGDLARSLTVQDAVLSEPQLSGLHAVGPRGARTLYVAKNDQTVTRHTVSEDGDLSPAGAPLDFDSVLGSGPFGEYGSSFQFITPEKAYYLQGGTLVVWNPSTMSITRTVSFAGSAEQGGVTRSGYFTSVSAQPLRIGQELFTFIGWHDVSRGILRESAVVAIDTASDAVRVISDTRCGYAREGALGPDGKIYLTTEAYATAFHYVSPDKAAAPCMLRFDPATKSFDAGFLMASLSELAGAEGAVGMSIASLLQGNDGSAYLKLFDPALAANAVSRTDARFLAAADAVFRWARVRLADRPALELLPALAPVGGSSVPLVLSGRHFAPSYRFEELEPGLGIRMPVETAFIELTAAGPQPAAMVVPGQAFSAVELR